jgi:hypothetical protein
LFVSQMRLDSAFHVSLLEGSNFQSSLHLNI